MPKMHHLGGVFYCYPDNQRAWWVVKSATTVRLTLARGTGTYLEPFERTLPPNLMTAKPHTWRPTGGRPRSKLVSLLRDGRR